MSRAIIGNKVPLHLQIGNTLMQRLRSGQYRPGQALPSYRELSRELGVSVGVVQRAINEVAAKGLLSVQPGKGIQATESSRALRASIPFGLIEPYAPGVTFAVNMVLFAEQVFSQKDNYVVIRSSQQNAVSEREIAEQMIHNGVQGLIVWPVDRNPNGEIFSRLAERVPIILVDRLISGATLPAVVYDSHQWGRDICADMLVTRGKKRMLVLLDDLEISSYQQLAHGIQSLASELSRQNDLTVIQLPISRFVAQLRRADFSMVHTYAEYLSRMLREQEYDSIFCFQDEFIDTVLIETGLYRQYPDLLCAVACQMHLNHRSRQFNESGVVQWAIDYPQMITRAAERLQHAVMSREPMSGVEKLGIHISPASQLAAEASR